MSRTSRETVAVERQGAHPTPSFTIGLVLLLWVWLAAVLVVNLPGHLTYDSLTQISEGRSGYVRSWNPVFGSWVFGSLVELTGGIEALVAISGSMLAAAVFLLIRHSRQSWWALPPLACLMFAPTLLVHPGVIWKDVWFAHMALLGYGFIAWRARGAGFWAEGIALVCLAAASLSRQTGIIVAAFGVLALTLAGSSLGARAASSTPLLLFRSLALHLSLRTVVLLLAMTGLSQWATQSMRQIEIGEVGTGVKLVAMFDMAGMLQRLPEAELSHLRKQGFVTDEWERSARASFSAERIDRLNLVAMSGPRELNTRDLLTQWKELVTQHPLTYAAHRLETFAWFSGLRNQAACIPIHVGVDVGPNTPTGGLSLRTPNYSNTLYQWSRSFVQTPYFAPLFWSGLSALVLLVLAWRRLWRDPILWLQVAGLAYSLSYLVAGISCDFRYSYFSVVAAGLGSVRLLADTGWPSMARWKKPADDRAG